MSPEAPYRPGQRVDWPAVRQCLDGLDLDDRPAALAQAGTDYHWYSPVLKRRLAGRRPDLLVRARSLDDVQRVAGACARHRVPLTVRGGGTCTAASRWT